MGDDTVTGRELSSFQALYIENHRALTKLLESTATTLKEGQDQIGERLEGVHQELRAVNGRVRATEDRTTRLEEGMKAAVAVQLEHKSAIDATGAEVHDIRLGGCAKKQEHEATLVKLDELSDLVLPAAQKKLTTPQKVGIRAGVSVGVSGVLYALFEAVRAIAERWK